MIFAYYLLFDCAFLYSARMSNVLCQVDGIIPVLFLRSIFQWDDHPLTKGGNFEWAKEYMFKSEMEINYILLTLVSVFSIGISIDLIKTIRYPIDRFDKRL